MSIGEFLNLTCDERLEEIIICKCSDNDCGNIFTGTCYDALHSELSEVKEALEMEISSWDMEDGKICLNYCPD